MIRSPRTSRGRLPESKFRHLQHPTSTIASRHLHILFCAFLAACAIPEALQNKGILPACSSVLDNDDPSAHARADHESTDITINKIITRTANMPELDNIDSSLDSTACPTPTSVSQCCCDREHCAYAKHNSAAIYALESEVRQAGRIGNVRLDFFISRYGHSDSIKSIFDGLFGMVLYWLGYRLFGGHRNFRRVEKCGG